MTEFFASLAETELLWHLLRASLLIGGGLLIARIISHAVFRLANKHFTPHHSILVKRILYWVVLGLFLASALREMGFSLGVVLSAAGVLSIAIGFAAQTSISNLISGLFLVGEKPFQLGDVIKVGETVGEVLSIDLLSVKLRTFDNLFVRIPNESLIKSQVTNMTRFPIRRFDFQIGVAYRENIAKVRDILSQVADRNHLCLDEPAPLFMFNGFGDSSLNIQYSVWAKRESFRDLRNSFQEEVKEAFDAAGIEIPFPHVTLYTGSETTPFPVQMVADTKSK